MLAVLDAFDESVGLVLAQTAAFDRLVEPRPRVPDADLEHRIVERACVGCSAEAFGLLLGEATSLHHLGEPLDETGAVLMHRPNLWRQSVAVKSTVSEGDGPYTQVVPKLWNDTIEAHRRAVREATLDTTAALVAEHGLSSVTMSQVAEEAGIGRATLYKYFSDIEAILIAWHERHIAAHLQHLADVRDQAGDPGERLAAVLEAYALIQHEVHNTELAALLHQGEHAARAQRHLEHFTRNLVAEAAETGDVRDDVAPDELAVYCLHALAAANRLRSKHAVRRLVVVTLAGLRPPLA